MIRKSKPFSITIKGYVSGVKYYGENKSLTNKEISEFFKSKVKKLATNNLINYLTALKSYAKFRRIKTIDWEKIRKVIPKTQRKFFDTINKKELEQLKRSRFEVSNEIYQRNNLMLDFLFYNGMRASELVSIKHRDYNFQQKTLTVLGKGNKVRYVLLPPFLVEKISKNSQNYLFSCEDGQPLSVRTINYIIQERVRKALINKRITPHSFRRSFATLLNRKKCNLTTIQKLLGHSSIETTTSYIHNDYNYLYQDYKKILL